MTSPGTIAFGDGYLTIPILFKDSACSEFSCAYNTFLGVLFGLGEGADSAHTMMTIAKMIFLGTVKTTPDNLQLYWNDPSYRPPVFNALGIPTNGGYIGTLAIACGETTVGDPASSYKIEITYNAKPGDITAGFASDLAANTNPGIQTIHFEMNFAFNASSIVFSTAECLFSVSDNGYFGAVGNEASVFPWFFPDASSVPIFAIAATSPEDYTKQDGVLVANTVPEDFTPGLNPFTYSIQNDQYEVIPQIEAMTALKTDKNIITDGVVIGKNIESHDYKLKTIGIDLTGLTGEVDNLEDRVGKDEVQINANTQAIAGNTSDIAANTTKINKNAADLQVMIRDMPSDDDSDNAAGVFGKIFKAIGFGSQAIGKILSIFPTTAFLGQGLAIGGSVLENVGSLLLTRDADPADDTTLFIGQISAPSGWKLFRPHSTREANRRQWTSHSRRRGDQLGRSRENGLGSSREHVLDDAQRWRAHGRRERNGFEVASDRH
jgi:hypothetical protein